MAEQQAMFGLDKEWWESHWRGMPEFVQEDLAPAASQTIEFPDGRLYIHFETFADRERFKKVLTKALPTPESRPEDLGREWLGKVVEQNLNAGKAHGDRKRTQSIWWPEAEIGRFAGKAYVHRDSLVSGDEIARTPTETPVPFAEAPWLPPEGGPRNPRHPVYIISKGRADTRYTSRALEALSIPYHIVVEPQERDVYASVIDPEKILVLPFSNLGQGSIPARNWVWEHSIEAGAERHWILDDNIQGFYRLNHNLKTPVADGTIFRAAEDLVDRYDNVAKFGFHYFMFASRKTKLPPFYTNTRVYSCICLRNDLEDRWRGRYNEDTDLSIRLLKRGFATVLFSAFLAFKTTTMTMKGGNTEDLYSGSESPQALWEKHEPTCDRCASGKPWDCSEARDLLDSDGRWRMALSLYEQHPDITRISRKWGRWQHHVDYSRFKRNDLKRRQDLPALPERDDYGMVLRVGEPESKRREIEHLPFVAPPAPPDWEPDPFPNLDGVRDIALDTETTGLRWWKGDRPCGMSLAWIDPVTGERRSCYLPWGHLPGGNLSPDRVLAWAKDALRGKKLYGLNLKFDLHMLRVWGLDLEALGCEVADVGHRAGLCDDHRQRFSLEAISQDILGEGKVAGVDVKRGAHIYHASTIAEYARRDAELVLRILISLLPTIEDQGLAEVVSLEDETIWPVIEMEKNGALIDVERLRSWDVKQQAHLMALDMKVRQLAGFPVNPKSHVDMERLYTARGVTVPRTESGKAKRDDDILKGLAATDPVFAALREFNQYRGLREKFVEPYLHSVGDDGILRYLFNQLPVERPDGGGAGTVSGRFSCSAPIRGEGANVQQVMKVSKHLKRFGDLYVTRELFIPQPGQLLFCADAKQIEYRLFVHFAALSLGSDLYKRYESDPETDFHQIVTDMVHGLGLTDFERDWIKNVNFMKLFGGGKGKTAKMLGTDIATATTFIEAYDRAFPEATRLLRKAMEVAQERGYVKTLTGRRARFDRDCKCPACFYDGKSNPRFYKALNGAIQGSAADVMKKKTREVYDARKRLGLTMRMTIHDELVLDTPDQAAADEVAKILNHQSFPLRVPLLWDAKTGANWREAK